MEGETYCMDRALWAMMIHAMQYTTSNSINNINSQMWFFWCGWSNISTGFRWDGGNKKQVFWYIFVHHILISNNFCLCMNYLETNAEDSQLSIPWDSVSRPRYPIETASEVSNGTFSTTKLNGKMYQETRRNNLYTDF